MDLFTNGKHYRFNNEDLDNRFINEGNEGVVYRVFNEAFKIYKPYSRKTRLNEKSAEHLSKIQTDRILMPKELIYDEINFFIGYTMPFLESYSKENIKKMKALELKKEIEKIKVDSEILSKNNVEIFDLHLDNLIFNDKGLYIIDPGSYKIKNFDCYYLDEFNMNEINELFLKLLKFSLKLTKAKVNELQKICSYSDITEIFKLSNEKDTVSSLVKKILS